MDRPHRITLRFLSEPNHAEHAGRVPGGVILRWIDQAGHTCAIGWTGEYCASKFVGGVHFLTPIHVGELIEIRAQVIRTDGADLTVAVDVYSGDPMANTMHRAGHCVCMYVARDERDQPRTVPPWKPGSPVEVALEQNAVRLAEFWVQLDQEMENRLKWLDEQRPSFVSRKVNA
ncbi:MAG TPA: hotdog domain-containing protein [Gemmatimonadales bacterium]|nr:hotdog domain-containing protein [Gemmatimonadales bacterium]